MTHLSSKGMWVFDDVNKVNLYIHITGNHYFSYVNVFYLLPYRGSRRDKKSQSRYHVRKVQISN